MQFGRVWSLLCSDDNQKQVELLSSPSRKLVFISSEGVQEFRGLDLEKGDKGNLRWPGESEQQVNVQDLDRKDHFDHCHSSILIFVCP